MPKIIVHEKALAHLSRGLYRSPASALRELVSNAWDANATEVRINTNYPFFYQLTVQDNGEGFTRKEFESIMGGGIGNSTKRASEFVILNSRPVIGRLGIGMLGIAQICGAFTIISKPKEGDGFRARVRLYDLLKEKLDEGDETVVKAEEVDVGEFDFEDFDAEKYENGTLLIADDIHPTFVRSFQKSVQHEAFEEPSLDWQKAVKTVSKVRSLQELGDYWRLLWELSVSCPIPYINEDALPNKLVVGEQKRLLGFKFSVIVDGIRLKKPIHLQGNPEGYTSFQIHPQSKRVYGKNLTFHGYLVVQEGFQLRPDELRGILIRIKNVAIGYYDPSMLDYRFNEGPRSRWLTGEIVVTEGLEDALNIDRDSFNRFHPEFRAVQEYVHEILHTEIFPVSYKKIEQRSVARQTSKDSARSKLLQEVLSEAVNAQVEIRKNVLFVKGQTTQEITTKPTDLIPEPDSTHIESPSVQVQVTEQDRGVQKFVSESKEIKTKKTYRQLASSILAIFELSLQEESKERQREVFTESLFKLLEGW